jgi:hypothetical protein
MRILVAEDDPHLGPSLKKDWRVAIMQLTSYRMARRPCLWG